MDTFGTSILSVIQGLSRLRGGREGVNSVPIVGRLSILQSVHYQRFHCIYTISGKSETLQGVTLKPCTPWDPLITKTCFFSNDSKVQDYTLDL